MFLTNLKTTLVEALKTTFDGEYPETDFRNLRISIEYPIERIDYPGIWVNFDVSGELENIGIAHRELETNPDDLTTRSLMRWRFQGNASFTIVSLTSLELDRLLDEVVYVLAFGTEQEQTAQFRAYIENNEFLAMNIDFDQIGIAGQSAMPGTPWGTDEVVYEVTVRVECLGEFVSEAASRTLTPLAEIVAYPYSNLENESQAHPPAVAVPRGTSIIGEPNSEAGEDGWR